MSQVKAIAKGLHISPRKLGLVAALVRGRSVKDSLTILQHTPRQGAPLLAKVVKSAVANAEHNQRLTTANLEVSSVMVSPGTTVKRFRSGSRGYVDPQRHRTSQVTVIVDDGQMPLKPAAPKISSAASTKGENDGPKS